MCVNIRVTRSQPTIGFSISKFDDLLDTTIGSSIFCKIDLRSAYPYIYISEGDEWSLQNQDGLY